MDIMRTIDCQPFACQILDPVDSRGHKNVCLPPEYGTATSILEPSMYFLELTKEKPAARNVIDLNNFHPQTLHGGCSLHFHWHPNVFALFRCAIHWGYR